MLPSVRTPGPMPIGRLSNTTRLRMGDTAMAFGAATRNTGVELTLRGTPVLRSGFSWDFLANFTRARGKVLSLPNALPESYVSDTWLYGNVRNGTQPGLSTMSLTGLFYLRNKNGDLLIDPTNGLPL